MKNYILITLLFTLSYTQIQQEGFPNFINSNNIKNIESIKVNKNQLIEKKFHPMVLKYGDEFSINFNIVNNINPIQSNNTLTYLLKIESKGALGIGLIFDDFYLSDNSTLYLYNEDGSMYIGAFTSKNNKKSNIFPTSIVKNDKIIIELNIPEDEIGQSRLNIGSLIHDYTDIMGYFSDLENTTREDCNINVSCPESAGFEDQINGTIRVTMGGGLCSASLINNTLNDRTPYVLFADHCVSGSPNSYVFLFNYQSATCNGTTGLQTQSVSGSNLLANAVIDSGPDFALLEITSNIPDSYNPYFVGWSNISITPQNVLGIHHPGGDIKKITQDATNINANGYYWEFQYNDGRVIPGSSGSPMFNQNKRQVGIASYIYTNYCDPSPDCYCSQQYNHGYGRFDQAWNMGLSQYLDPINSGVSFIDGIGISGINIAHENLNDIPYEETSISISAEVTSYLGNIEVVELSYDIGEGWNTTEMTLNLDQYEGNISGLYDGMIVEYFLMALNSDGITQYYPPNGTENPIYFTVGDLPDFYSTEFETELNNWTIGSDEDNATAGIWELADPVGTYNDNNLLIQPDSDHTLNGTQCFITGNGYESGNGGFDDVDGGKTTLSSPTFDLSNTNEVLVTYWYWYTNNIGDNGGSDKWKVQVSSNGGNSWNDLHITANSNTEWIKKRIKLSDYTNLTNNIKFQFIAEDISYNGDTGSGGSLVEAALDDFLIEIVNSNLGITGDINSDNLVNILDAVIIINMILDLIPSDFSTADLNSDNTINILDIIILINIILNS